MASLIDRAKNILIAPKAEWPVIAAEPATTSGLFTRYVLILAALPVVAGFVKDCFIGTSIPFTDAVVRIGVGIGVTSAVVQYGLSLLAVYLLALVVDALAPSFGGERDRLQALKTVAYTYTASWIAGLAVMLPWVGVLIGIAGGVYTVYLLYLGLPHTMRAPPDRAGGYTSVVVLLGFLIGIVIGIVGGAISGAASVGALSRGSGVEIDTGGSKIKLDQGALGRLEDMARQMEDVGKRMEDAQKSGDEAGQQAALGDALGTMFGGGQRVETLAPDALKPFLPEKLAGLPRTSFNVERNTALGIQMSKGTAHYGEPTAGAPSLELEVSDLGGLSGLTILAGWAMVQTESESNDGYERSYQKDGMRTHEKWDGASRYGTYEVVIADRFLVKVEGRGLRMDDLKNAAASVDLSALAALKDQGREAG